MSFGKIFLDEDDRAITREPGKRPKVPLNYEGRVSVTNLAEMFKDYSLEQLDEKTVFLKKELLETKGEIKSWQKRRDDIQYYIDFIKRNKNQKVLIETKKEKDRKLKEKRTTIINYDDHERYKNISKQVIPAFIHVYYKSLYPEYKYNIAPAKDFTKKEFIATCMEWKISLKLLIVFHYKYINKLPTSVIAKLENVSEASVRQRLESIRRATRHPQFERLMIIKQKISYAE